MKRLDRTMLTNAHHVGRTIIAPVILLFLLITAPNRARGDELTGQAQDDPKDLLPAPATPTQPTYSTGTQFAPMPGWARGATLGPLPDKLTPMGRSAKVASTTPASLAPPKDPVTPTPTTATAASSKATGSDPTMMTVSPFLQWIKSNPQAAAVEARQEAQSYRPAPAPENSPASANATTRNSQDDSYWLPPLIDSATFSSPVVTGSAAIYSRPQR